MTGAELLLLDRTLPRGEANATSVPALMRALGWSERSVREGLEQLVDDGLEPFATDPRRVPIVTLPRTGGRSVFVAVTPEELDKGVAHIRSKARAGLYRARRLRMCKPQVVYHETLF